MMQYCPICGAKAKWAEGSGIKGTPDAYEKTEYTCGAIYEKCGTREPEPKYNELSGTYRCPLGDEVVKELREQLEALKVTCEGLTLYITATDEQLSTVTEQRDKLLEVAKEAAKRVHNFVFYWNEPYGVVPRRLMPAVDSLQAAIALCEPKEQG